MKTKGYLLGATAILAISMCGAVTALAQSTERWTIEESTPGATQYYGQLPEQLPTLNMINEGILVYDDSGLYAEGFDGRQLIATREAMGETPYYIHYGGDLMSANIGNDWVLWDYKTRKELYRYTFDRRKWRHIKTTPQGDYALVSDGKNIAVVTPGSEPIPLTTDGSFDIAYGTAVHRNEFGIDGGLFPSPDGRYFAFYRNDQSGVEPYPIVRMNDRIAYHDPIKYPMAGRQNERVTVGIYDSRAGDIKYLETALPTDRFFTNISWSPDSKSLFIDEVSRDQTETHLREYDVTTGLPVRTLLTETHPKYIEPGTPIRFLSDGRFIRLSRINGYNHLYLYNRDGALVAQLTDGKWEVMELMGIDEASGQVYFMSNKDYTIGQDLYRVSLRNPLSVQRLTEGNGSHFVWLSPDCRLAYDRFSNLDTPNVERLIALDGTEPRTRELLRAADPLTDKYRPVVELGSLKSDAGDDLYYKITRPAQLEEGKKYPVVLYVYGGPHSQLVTDSWRGLRMGWDTYMAQEGFIVMTIDNRGTANRGMDFESITHRRLGTIEMQDQMKGIEYLRSLPYVDADRIGVYGWSFGGFMTTNLMLTHPETFKVGVAGGPVMNWAYYEIMYGERYMDTPQENPEGYAESNLIDRAGDLKGRLLLIHGGIDPVVLWQHSQLFLQASVKAGTLPDYMVYPMDEHNVRGQDRVHLHRVICRYFMDHL
ncbi:MAG: DPP IV N-terminal domain-containing protein [Porphyromonas sp.]|nr:DPP IV N-terminal domain-containing protein [Porphyromonas sp.]